MTFSGKPWPVLQRKPLLIVSICDPNISREESSAGEPLTSHGVRRSQSQGALYPARG